MCCCSNASAAHWAQGDAGWHIEPGTPRAAELWRVTTIWGPHTGRSSKPFGLDWWWGGSGAGAGAAPEGGRAGSTGVPFVMSFIQGKIEYEINDV